MKNILHITTWYPNDYDRQLGIFVKKHIQQGHAFASNVVIAIIANPTVNKPRVKVNRQDNFTEIIGYYRARPHSKWSNYRNYLRVQTLVMQAYLKLNVMPDFIHCHVGEKSIALAKKFFDGVPRFVTEHWSGFLNGTFETYKEKRQKTRIAEINTCRKLLVVSEALKVALTQYGVKIPIEIIPNIIEQGKVKSAYSIPPKFVVVADLVDEVKNVSGIIEAFRQAKINGSTLTIIGDGPDRNKLEEIAEHSPIEFLGRQENDWVLEHLSDYDLLIVNSNTETYSMITAEALLCGLPVIATKCGGPEQFIEENKNGWLHEVGNTEQLASHIQKSPSVLLNLIPGDISNDIKDQVSLSTVQQIFSQLYV